MSVTIYTVLCKGGGYCEFTKVGAHDLHCRKCDAPAGPIIELLEPEMPAGYPLMPPEPPTSSE